MRQDDERHLWESDLACERHRAEEDIPGIRHRTETRGELTLERITVESEEGARSIGRPMGRYDTLTLPPLESLTEELREQATEVLTRELCSLTEGALGHAPTSLLAVGLGNAAMTADAVGPRTVRNIRATRHLRAYDERMFRALDCAAIAVLEPGVSASSGLDAADTVAAVCRDVRPEAVLVFDALAARSTERLGRTVQLCDTGICPGSGVGNHRRPLDQKTLGCPVIAVGVPTVSDSRIFFEEMAHEQGLTVGEKTKRAGLFVTPRDVDALVEEAAKLLGAAVNRAFGIQLA